MVLKNLEGQLIKDLEDLIKDSKPWEAVENFN